MSMSKGEISVPLIPYEPFRQMDLLRKNMDRLFEDWPLGRYWENISHNRIDLYETEDELVAMCELPGLEKQEDVDIAVDQQTLTISGRLQRSQEIKDEQYHRRERFTGTFSRSIPLPVPVQTDGITAAYRNGILEIHMPKAQGGNRRRIDVQFH